MWLSSVGEREREEAEGKRNLSLTYSARPPSVTSLKTIKLQEIYVKWNSQLCHVQQWITLPGISIKSHRTSKPLMSNYFEKCVNLDIFGSIKIALTVSIQQFCMAEVDVTHKIRLYLIGTIGEQICIQCFSLFPRSTTPFMSTLWMFQTVTWWQQTEWSMWWRMFSILGVRAACITIQSCSVHSVCAGMHYFMFFWWCILLTDLPVGRQDLLVLLKKLIKYIQIKVQKEKTRVNM